ncbi:MAG: fibronectin type III domain-containing protein [Salinibacter sp.]
MASPDTRSDPPAPPELVAPQGATVVNGEKVTLAWKPSREADRYRLQVAKTARFDELVVDEDVGNETAVTVGNQFPTDGQTFFWRVTAGSYAEWGEPSRVESFVAATEEDAEQDLLSEPVAGPATGLARAAKREVTRRVFGFEDQLEEEKERGVAYEGVAASQIIAIAVSILVVILVAVVVLFGWYGQVSQETRASVTDTENYQLLKQTQTKQEAAISRYGIVNEKKGVYRIPIEQSMDVVANGEYQRTQSGEGQRPPASKDSQ